MKNLVWLIFAMGLFALPACTSTGGGLSNAKKIEILESKLWVLNQDEIMADLLKQGANSTRLNVVEPTLERLQFATFKFSNGNKVELNLNNGSAPVFGTYKISPDGTVLDWAFGDRPGIAHPIILLSEDKIIFGDDVKKGLLYKKILIPFDVEKSKGNDKERISTKGKKKVDLKDNIK